MEGERVGDERRRKDRMRLGEVTAQMDHTFSSLVLLKSYSTIEGGLVVAAAAAAVFCR